MLKVGSEYVWPRVADTDSKSKVILKLSISKERNMFVVAERFLSSISRDYGKHPVSTEMVAVRGSQPYGLQVLRDKTPSPFFL